MGCQAVPQSPPHFSDLTPLACCCYLLLWLLREAPALRKTRNQFIKKSWMWKVLPPCSASQRLLSIISPAKVKSLPHGWAESGALRVPISFNGWPMAPRRISSAWRSAVDASQNGSKREVYG